MKNNILKITILTAILVGIAAFMVHEGGWGSMFFSFGGLLVLLGICALIAYLTD